MEKFVVLVIGASTTVLSSAMRFRINGDTGTNYAFGGFSLHTPATYNTSIIRPDGVINNDFIQLGSMSDVVGSSVTCSITIQGGTKTGGKEFTVLGTGLLASGTSGMIGRASSGVYLGSATISSVSIFADSGNFDAGTIYVYGSA